jgi:Domain of unknown function (DUF4440)
MKSCLAIICFLVCATVQAQSKQATQALANTKLLEQTVFGTKDSVTLEKLFGSSLTYIHSSGKVESREEAIHGIIHNKSVYTKADTLINYDVKTYADSTLVKHLFKATEKKADGTESKLNLYIVLVWMKENGKWKLFRREATKIQ